MRTWQRDVELDLNFCHQIVIDQFPQFAGQTPEDWGQGWDNICVLYGRETVFRLPTRAAGGKIIVHEIAALPHLRTQVPLPIPDFRFVGKPTENYPYHFVGYPLLRGTTSDRMSWNAQQRVGTAVVLGEFLKSLHQVPLTPELTSSLPTGPHGRASIDWLLDRIQFRRDAVITSHPERKAWAGELSAFADDLSQDLLGEDQSVVIHGDLYPRHILADQNHQITGIIDWGDVQIGHPSSDLSVAFTFLEKGDRDAFWKAYDLPVARACRSAAKLKAILYALSLYSYGMDIGDQPIWEIGELIGIRVMDF